MEYESKQYNPEVKGSFKKSKSTALKNKKEKVAGRMKGKHSDLFDERGKRVPRSKFGTRQGNWMKVLPGDR